MNDPIHHEEVNASTPLMDSQQKTSYPACPSIQFFQHLFDSGNINTKISSKTFENEGFSTGIFKHLKVDISTGLDFQKKDDLEWRRQTWGDNAEITQEVYGFWHFVWDALQDKMLQILLLAALISLIIGIIQEGLSKGWIEGTSIFFAVFIVVSISSWINYSKDQQFHALNTENNKKTVPVKRNGVEEMVDVYSLLVGDLLQLSIGAIIPVDGILTSGQVMIDESSMTGESDLVKKTPTITVDKENSKKTSLPFIISGTKVNDGTGYMVVCAVGENSIMGRAMSLATGDEDAKTPLQEKLGDLADQIGSIGGMVAGLIGLVLVLKDFLIKFMAGQSIFVQSSIDAIMNAFIISVVVIVVAIPEGLPMAVTISLAYSVRKMNDEHCLVKNLNAAETMGNVK
jgi:Ca2+ transporting ATPase